jgi:AbrB family looped-hinge helix DNA binding protein
MGKRHYGCPMSAYRGVVRLDRRGRLVLPAALRHRLGLKPGEELLIIEGTDGVLQVSTRRTAAHALIGLAGSLHHSAVDDLRAERTSDSVDLDAVSSRYDR